MRTILSIFISLVICVSAYSTEYHVSTSGNDGNAGSIGSPWLTPVYGGSQLDSDGDILYIHAGDYNIVTSSSGQSSAIYPRANNCIIKNYANDVVTLKGNNGVAPTNGVIGTGSTSGLTIDGFIIEGIVVFSGGSGGTVQNCDISIGSDSWSGIAQGEVIWVQGSSDVSIINNKIHDNTIGVGAGSPANSGLIMMYQCTTGLIENNNFYNSIGTAITMKDKMTGVVIRKNYFYDNDYSAIWTGNNSITGSADCDIYQNIFKNNNTEAHAEHGAISLVIVTSNVDIYNNTFYGNYVADLLQWPSGQAVPFTFFNNISATPISSHLSWPYSESVFAGTYLDYNQYYNDVQWKYRTTTDTTISDWRTTVNSLLSGADVNSIITNPNFINPGGSNPEDYKRSSYPTNGRGGTYEDVMGAYITGDEIIGYTTGTTPNITGLKSMDGGTIH